MHNTHKTKLRGFTLIEMAIVLVIIGLLIGLTLPLVQDLIKSGKRSEAERFMDQVNSQIIGFAIMNSGQLPSDLGTDLGIGTDPYGNDVIYIVQNDDTLTSGFDFTDTPAVLCNGPTSSTDISVDEVDGDGNTTTVTNVAYIIATAGRDVTDDSALNTALDTGANATITDPREYGNANPNNEYDDIVLYSTLSYLKNKVCSNLADSSTAPKGSDVSFANDMDSFPNPDATTDNNVSSDNVVNVNGDEGTAELGGSDAANAWGCLWYVGSLDDDTDTFNECTNGQCYWDNWDDSGGAGDSNDATAIRVFFKFKFDDTETDTTNSTDYGAGFTFTIMSAETADTRVNTTDRCGGDGNAFMGYAGAEGNDGGGLYPPKIAIEVDTYQNNNRDGDITTATNTEPNHVSIVFWADGADNPLMPGNNDNNDAEVFGPTINDPNGACATQDTSPARDETALGFLVDSGNPTWLEDGNEHTMRIEIERSALITDLTTCTSGAGGANSYRTYSIQVWIDSSSANATDLTLDLAAADAGTGLFTETTTNYEEGEATTRTFDSFFFGWTTSTANTTTQNVTLSDFGINMVDI